MYLKVKVAFFLRSAEMALPWNCSGIYYSTAGARLKLQ